MAKRSRPRMGIEEKEARPPQQPPSIFAPFAPRGAEPPPPPPPPPPPRGEPGTPVPESPPGRMPWERMFGAPTPVGRAAARPAAPARPAGPPAWVRPSVDPSQFFDMKALFDHIRSQRQSAGWRAGTYVPLYPLARPTKDALQAASEVGRFFKLSDAEISRYGERAWQYIVEPFVRELERAMNLAKPTEIPGAFRLGFFRFDPASADESFGLAYVE